MLPWHEKSSLTFRASMSQAVAKPEMGWRLVYAIKLVEAVHVGALAIPKLLGARKSEASFGDNLPGEAVLPCQDGCTCSLMLSCFALAGRKRALAFPIA